MRKGYSFAAHILAGMVGTPSIVTAQDFLSPSNARIQAYGSDRPSMDTLLSPDAVSSAPPVSITQPILALKYCVALNGVFPPRF